MIQPNMFTAFHERVMNLRTSPPPDGTVFGLSRSVKTQKQGNPIIEEESEDDRHDKYYYTP
jgi:hypothetical protein